MTQHNGQAAFVYVLQENTAHMRSIKAGVTDAGLTEVTGINPAGHAHRRGEDCGWSGEHQSGRLDEQDASGKPWSPE